MIYIENQTKRNNMLKVGIVLLLIGVFLSLAIGVQVFENLRDGLLYGGLSKEGYLQKGELNALKDDLDTIKNDLYDIKTATDPDSQTIGGKFLGSIENFSIEGKEYSLSFDYKELLDDGWDVSESLEAPAPTKLEAGEEVYTYLTKKDSHGNEMLLGLSLYNNQQQDVATEDSIVLGIMLESQNNRPESFSFESGIKLDSTKKEVIATLGDPWEVYQLEKDRIQYTFCSEDQQKYIFVFFETNENDAVVSEIHLQNYSQMIRSGSAQEFTQPN